MFEFVATFEEFGRGKEKSKVILADSHEEALTEARSYARNRGWDLVNISTASDPLDFENED